MIDLIINAETRIETLPLTFSNIDGSLVVGSFFKGTSYLKTSELGVEAIKLLNQNMNILDVEQVLSNRNQENIKIHHLVNALYDSNLIHKIDNKIVSNPKILKNGRFLSELAKHFFSNFALFVYVGLMVAGSISIVLNSDILLFPKPVQTFGFFISSLLIGWMLTLKHEWFHYLAALSVGVPAQIKFGTRFFFVVLETDVSALYTLERKKRYRVYLAGIWGDIVVCSIFFLVKSFNQSELNVSLDFALIASLGGILFQFNVFLKTDLYFVVADFFHLKNLYMNSDVLIKSWLGFRFKNMTYSKSVFVFSVLRIINYVILSLIVVLVIIGLFLHQAENPTPVEESNQFSYGAMALYFIVFLAVKYANRKKHKPQLLFKV